MARRRGNAPPLVRKSVALLHAHSQLAAPVHAPGAIRGAHAPSEPLPTVEVKDLTLGPAQAQPRASTQPRAGDPFERWRQELLSKPVLEANVYNRETADLFYHHLRELHLRAFVGDPVPPPKELFDMQEQLLGWVDHAAVKHKCNDIHRCEYAKRDPNLHECSGVMGPNKEPPCSFLSFPRAPPGSTPEALRLADFATSPVLDGGTKTQEGAKAKYPVTHNVFVCAHSGKVHQCNSRCPGDLVDPETQERTCSISKAVKGTGALCFVHRNMMYTAQGERVGGVTQWNDLAASRSGAADAENGDGDQDAAGGDQNDDDAQEDEEDFTSKAVGGDDPEWVPGASSFAPLEALVASDASLSAALAPEREIFARRVQGIPSMHSDLEQSRALMVSRSATDAKVAERMRNSEAQMVGGHKTAEEYKGERADTALDMKRKSGQIFDAIATRSTMKRRKTQPVPEGGGVVNVRSTYEYHMKCMRIRFCPLLPRDKVLAVLGNVVEDLLTGPNARKHHEDGLKERQTNTLKAAQRYATASLTAYRSRTGPPPTMLGLVTSMFLLRDDYMWRSAALDKRVKWSEAHKHYVHKLMVLWNLYGPFVHTAQNARGEEKSNSNTHVAELVRFAMSMLYFLMENQPVVYQPEAEDAPDVMITENDDFLQRHMVPSTHLTNVSGSITYQQGWINKQYNIFTKAMDLACITYEKAGRLSELSWSSVEAAVRKSASQ